MKQTVHIVGGGLAGLSLALGLRRQEVPVVIHEANQYPRHRVCGEFILGVNDAVLEQLDLSVPLEDALRHDTCVWFAGVNELGCKSLPMAARAISRFRLDERLAIRALEQGATLQCQDRIATPTTDGWVEATGRRKQAEGNWLGLKAHYHHLPLRAGLEMHLGQGGYVGLTAVEDGRVNVCALLPAGGGGDKQSLLPRKLREIGLHEIANRLDNATVDPHSITGVSHFRLGTQKLPREPGKLILGDGHAMIPPFTGAGMSMAFESAAVALPLLVSWSEGRLAWLEAVHGIQHSLRKHFRARMGWAAVVHRALLSRWGGHVLSASVGWRWVPFDSLVRVLRGA